jgi:hypothetical protein
MPMTSGPRRGPAGRVLVLAAAAALAAALLALWLLTRSGTLDAAIADAGVRADSARMALVDAAGFARFRNGHAAVTYQRGVELRQAVAAAGAAAEAARQDCVAQAVASGGSAAPCLDGTDAAGVELVRARRELREFEGRWFDALAAEAGPGSARTGPRASFRIPRAEPFVLVARVQTSGDPDDPAWYWVGWTSLEGRRTRLVELDARNRVHTFPFRDPPGNFSGGPGFRRGTD